jgi:hypothetical protein
MGGYVTHFLLPGVVPVRAYLLIPGLVTARPMGSGPILPKGAREGLAWLKQAGLTTETQRNWRKRTSTDRFSAEGISWLLLCVSVSLW